MGRPPAILELDSDLLENMQVPSNGKRKNSVEELAWMARRNEMSRFKDCGCGSIPNGNSISNRSMVTQDGNNVKPANSRTNSLSETKHVCFKRLVLT